MTKMLTLFGEDIGKLPYNDLKRERQVQRYLLVKLKSLRGVDEYKLENMQKPSQVASDKVSILDVYVSHLEAFIEEIDYWLGRKFEPTDNYKGGHKRKWKIQKENEAKRKHNIAENARAYKWQKGLERDSLMVSWDKERFILIASDRGYQTDEALVQAVGKELNLDRVRAKLIIDKGRFTWGQVLCLGAMMQMTPKEFCDTFLAGYFTEQFGEYRADYENLCKTELLKTAVKPMDVVEVGADGRPLDEEEWFD